MRSSITCWQRHRAKGRNHTEAQATLNKVEARAAQVEKSLVEAEVQVTTVQMKVADAEVRTLEAEEALSETKNQVSAMRAAQATQVQGCLGLLEQGRNSMPRFVYCYYDREGEDGMVLLRTLKIAFLLPFLYYALLGVDILLSTSQEFKKAYGKHFGEKLKLPPHNPLFKADMVTEDSRPRTSSMAALK